MNCKEANIEPCWVCMERTTTVSGGFLNCSIDYFHQHINSYGESVEHYILYYFKNLDRSIEDLPAYLRKTLELYYPDYVSFFDKISVLV